MKTETSALHYDTPSPLKVIDIASKASRHLNVIKGEEADKKQQNPVLVTTSSTTQVHGMHPGFLTTNSHTQIICFASSAETSLEVYSVASTSSFLCRNRF